MSLIVRPDAPHRRIGQMTDATAGNDSAADPEGGFGFRPPRPFPGAERREDGLPGGPGFQPDAVIEAARRRAAQAAEAGRAAGASGAEAADAQAAAQSETGDTDRRVDEAPERVWRPDFVDQFGDPLFGFAPPEPLAYREGDGLMLPLGFAVESRTLGHRRPEPPAEPFAFRPGRGFAAGFQPDGPEAEAGAAAGEPAAGRTEEGTEGPGREPPEKPVIPFASVAGSETYTPGRSVEYKPADSVAPGPSAPLTTPVRPPMAATTPPMSHQAAAAGLPAVGARGHSPQGTRVGTGTAAPRGRTAGAARSGSWPIEAALEV
jgi:hypothetical protein